MVDSQTELVGLIGWPVAHSVSPAMHNAAFEALGLNWRYVPLPVRPGQVETAVRGLGVLGFRGANVTVPHKRAVIPALDSLGPNARALGAVNTLVIGQREDSSAVICGFNTDGEGALSALRGGGFEPKEHGRAVVVGAGGAARAVAFGLLRSGIGEVAVLNRTFERAEALVADLSEPHTWSGTAHALPLTPETLIESARTADLLVNATSVGMWPHGDESPWLVGVPLPAHLIVFDLVYNPPETQLLGQARESGAHPVGGLGMLVHQGALAFQMWTGEWPPTDVMRAAAEKALRSGH